MRGSGARSVVAALLVVHCTGGLKLLSDRAYEGQTQWLGDIDPSHAESEYVRHRTVVNQFQAVRENLEPNFRPPWTLAAPPLGTCVLTKVDMGLALSVRTACPAGNRNFCGAATGRSKPPINNLSSGSSRASALKSCPTTPTRCRA
jgi:hypothetical protein